LDAAIDEKAPTVCDGVGTGAVLNSITLVTAGVTRSLSVRFCKALARSGVTGRGVAAGAVLNSITLVTAGVSLSLSVRFLNAAAKSTVIGGGVEVVTGAGIGVVVLNSITLVTAGVTRSLSVRFCKALARSGVTVGAGVFVVVVTGAVVLNEID